jgi:hypothetical protein
MRCVSVKGESLRDGIAWGMGGNGGHGRGDGPVFGNAPMQWGRGAGVRWSSRLDGAEAQDEREERAEGVGPSVVCVCVVVPST